MKCTCWTGSTEPSSSCPRSPPSPCRQMASPLTHPPPGPSPPRSRPYLDGSITDIELRIDQVEDFAGMREAALETFERVGDSGAAARGRVDSISRTSSTTARVVYSILLNDQVVFEAD